MVFHSHQGWSAFFAALCCARPLKDTSYCGADIDTTGVAAWCEQMTVSRLAVICCCVLSLRPPQAAEQAAGARMGTRLP